MRHVGLKASGEITDVSSRLLARATSNMVTAMTKSIASNDRALSSPGTEVPQPVVEIDYDRTYLAL